MKKCVLLSLIILLALLFACGNGDDENYNNEPPTQEDTNQEPNGSTPDDNDNNNDSNNETNFAEEWSWFYGASRGNTAGNVNNGGRVTHDFHQKLHYISSNQKLYSFDPVTGQTEVIYQFVSGSATHLNTFDNLLYFIHNDSGELFRYDLTENTLERLLDEDQENVFFLHRMDSRIHVLHYGTYGLEWGLYISRDNWIMSRTYNIVKFSEYGNRVLLLPENSLTLQIRDAGQGAGSNWVDFEKAHQVTDIKDYLFINFDQSYQNNVGLILETHNISGMFMYYAAKEDPLVPIKTGHIDDFSNLNYDSVYVYFLHQNTLYRFTYDTPESLEPYLVLNGNIAEVNIVNHWVYYRQHNSTVIYQVHPDTKEITTFD